MFKNYINWKCKSLGDITLQQFPEKASQNMMNYSHKKRHCHVSILHE